MRVFKAQPRKVSFSMVGIGFTLVCAFKAQPRLLPKKGRFFSPPEMEQGHDDSSHEIGPAMLIGSEWLVTIDDPAIAMSAVVNGCVHHRENHHQQTQPNQPTTAILYHLWSPVGHWWLPAQQPTK